MRYRSRWSCSKGTYSSFTANLGPLRGQTPNPKHQIPNRDSPVRGSVPGIRDFFPAVGYFRLMSKVLIPGLTSNWRSEVSGLWYLAGTAVNRLPAGALGGGLRSPLSTGGPPPVGSRAVT